MLILLDGPDGAGKSTMAKAIAARVPGTEILKRNAPELPPLVEYTADLADYKPGSGRSLVCDRWHLGERVYGPLYRGGCSLSPVMWGAVEAFLYNLGAVLMIVTAPPEHLFDRLTKRGEQPDFVKLQDELDAFSRAGTWTQLTARRIMTNELTTSEQYDKVVGIVIDLARKEEAHAADTA